MDNIFSPESHKDVSIENTIKKELMAKDFTAIRDFVKRSTKDVEAENLRNASQAELSDEDQLKIRKLK